MQIEANTSRFGVQINKYEAGNNYPLPNVSEHGPDMPNKFSSFELKSTQKMLPSKIIRNSTKSLSTGTGVQIQDLGM